MFVRVYFVFFGSLDDFDARSGAMGWGPGGQNLGVRGSSALASADKHSRHPCSRRRLSRFNGNSDMSSNLGLYLVSIRN